MTIIDELKALIEKYGFDPKNGGIAITCYSKACGEMTINTSGLCDDCERKEATE